MALYVLGDTHLSLGASKPMDVFPGWNGYVERLERNWRKLIKPEDTIVLAGDISWAQGFCVFTGASRPEADHEGKPRLLVDHGQQDERLPQG
jgi:hypothetical protein